MSSAETNLEIAQLSVAASVPPEICHLLELVQAEHTLTVAEVFWLTPLVGPAGVSTASESEADDPLHGIRGLDADAHSEPEPDLQRAMLLTIDAGAAGMRNTG